LAILYPFSVRYVCKLDSWAHILWAFGFGLKTGLDNQLAHTANQLGKLDD
jgi:hypothetical protein